MLHAQKTGMKSLENGQYFTAAEVADAGFGDSWSKTEIEDGKECACLRTLEGMPIAHEIQGGPRRRSA